MSSVPPTPPSTPSHNPSSSAATPINNLQLTPPALSSTSSKMKTLDLTGLLNSEVLKDANFQKWWQDFRAKRINTASKSNQPPPPPPTAKK